MSQAKRGTRAAVRGGLRKRLLLCVGLAIAVVAAVGAGTAPSSARAENNTFPWIVHNADGTIAPAKDTRNHGTGSTRQYNADRWNERVEDFSWSDSGVAASDVWREGQGTRAEDEPPLASETLTFTVPVIEANPAGSPNSPQITGEATMGADTTFRLVSTAAQFRWCLENKANIWLVKNIDLGGRQGQNWNKQKPPAIQRGEKLLINGNGKTVYNMYCSLSSTCGGLIPEVWSEGFVMANLNVQSAYLETSAGSNTGVGMLVGRNAAGMVYNCTARTGLVNGGNGSSQHVGGLFSPNDYASGALSVIGVRAYGVTCYGGDCVACFSHGRSGDGGGAWPWVFMNCSLVDSCAISNGGHSGGFASCMWGNGDAIYFKNCYTNVDVYGNKQTGVFVGAIHNGAHYFENCYAAGKIEGTDTIGGFAAYCDRGNTARFKNCYSTSMVGMANTGATMGGFIGSGPGSKFEFINCYAAGEVGTLDTNDDGSPYYGFTGNGTTTGTGAYTNCYYDKQTTAMRERGKGTGVDGLLTSQLIGKAEALGDAWVSTGSSSYPQLRVFAEQGSDEDKAFSEASASTVLLTAYSDTDYDTVRSIRNTFPLTNDTNNTNAYHHEWSIYEGEDTTNPTFPNKSPIVAGAQVLTLEEASVGIADNVCALAPGVAWLQAQATTQDGAVGFRRLRLVPTTSITFAKANDKRYAEPDGSDMEGLRGLGDALTKYNHRADVMFTTMSAKSLNKFIERYGWVDDQATIDANINSFSGGGITKARLGEAARGTVAADRSHLTYDAPSTAGGKVRVSLLKHDGTSYAPVTWTDDLIALFEGGRRASMATEPTDLGSYRLDYVWETATGGTVAQNGAGAKTLNVVEPGQLRFWSNYGEEDGEFGTLLARRGLYLDGESMKAGKERDAGLGGVPADPTRPGYDFAGWAYAVGSDAFDEEDEVPAGTTDVLATWRVLAPAASISKTAVDPSSADGLVHVGDTVTYTVTVGNSYVNALWRGVRVTDELPAGFELDASSVRLDGAAVSADSVSVAGGVMTVAVGDLLGSTSKTLAYSGVVTNPGAVTNRATAVGTDADGETEYQAGPATASPGEAAPTPYKSLVDEEADGWVVASDGRLHPVPGGFVSWEVGADMLSGNSSWKTVSMADRLPDGLELVGVVEVFAGGVSVGTAAYDAGSRTVSYTYERPEGSRPDKVFMRLRAQVASEGAVGKVFTNVAAVGLADDSGEDVVQGTPTSQTPAVVQPGQHDADEAVLYACERETDAMGRIYYQPNLVIGERITDRTRLTASQTGGLATADDSADSWARIPQAEGGPKPDDTDDYAWQWLGWTDDPRTSWNPGGTDRLLGKNDPVRAGENRVWPVYARRDKATALDDDGTFKDPGAYTMSKERVGSGPAGLYQELEYKVAAHNVSADASWDNVTFVDKFPANASLVEGSVRLAIVDYNGVDRTSGADGRAVQSFELAPSGSAEDGYVYDAARGLLRHRVTAGWLASHALTVGEGQSLELRFKIYLTRGCMEDGSRGELVNEGSVSWYPPDGEGGEPLWVSADTAPVGVPTDPGTRSIQKAVSNLTREGETADGDTVRYTITVVNNKRYAWESVTVLDVVPEGLAVDAASIRLTDGAGAEHVVDAAAWDQALRRICVGAGTLAPGQSATVAFQATVTDAVQATRKANVGYAKGFDPGDEGSAGGPGAGEAALWDTPLPDEGFSDGTGVIAGTETGLASSGAALPPVKEPAPSDGNQDDANGHNPLRNVCEPNDPDILQKQVAIEGGDEAWRDVLRYTVTLHNPLQGPAWEDMSIFDYLPSELAFVPGSLTLTGPDGQTKTLPDSYFRADEHIFEVPVGSVAYDETYVMEYRAGVPDEVPVSKELVNHAKVNVPGTDPKAARPENRATAPIPHTGDVGAVAMGVAATGLACVVLGATLRRCRTAAP